MKDSYRSLLLAALFFAALSSAAQRKKAPAEPAPALQEQRVQQEVARLSLISGGVVGVSAIHVETGKRIGQRGVEYFPMASSYKVPIAIQLLTRVDSGMLSIDQLMEIDQADLHPGSGMLSERFNWPGAVKPGVALSVRSLLELMLLISDNSATDICLRLAGGPSAVNTCMKRLGIQGLRVDRPTANLIADWLGIPMDPDAVWSRRRFDSLAKTITTQQQMASSRKFDADLKDSSTPDAMTALLLRLYTQPILNAESRLLLLDIMRRCESGLTRLKGALPPGTEVMHKTGTIGMTTNDVGIMTLPGDAGHVVISVFVKSSEKPVADRERAIAEIARVIHDYFLLNR
ncbi:MAG: class A beta-lactamase [Cytophagales bacterium]|nr:class A beta-lactamase [Cytophagales bacterium]